MSIKKIFTFGAYKYAMLAQPIDTAALCSLCDSRFSLCEGQYLTLSQAHAKHKPTTAKVLSWPRHPWGGQYRNGNQWHLRFAPHPEFRGTRLFPELRQESKRSPTGLQTWVMYSVKGCVSHYQVRKAGHTFFTKAWKNPVRWTGWLQNFKQIFTWGFNKVWFYLT